MVLDLLDRSGPRAVTATNASGGPLHGAVADAFTAGLHAAFYALTGFMVLAADQSALRPGSARTIR